MKKSDWSALSNTMAGATQLFAPPGSQQWNMANTLMDSARAQAMAEEAKKREEEEKKKKKAGLFGKIGSTLGTVGGVLLAPLTGGTSLLIPAAMGAGGSMLGGAAGTLLGGGKIDGADMLGYGLSGGLGGLTGGMAGGFGKTALKTAPAIVTSGGPAATTVLGAAAAPGSRTELLQADTEAGMPGLMAPVPKVTPYSTGTTDLGSPIFNTRAETNRNLVSAMVPDAVSGIQSAVSDYQSAPSVATVDPGRAAQMGSDNTRFTLGMRQQDNQQQQRTSYADKIALQREIEGEKNRSNRIKLEEMRLKNEERIAKIREQKPEFMSLGNGGVGVARIDETGQASIETLRESRVPEPKQQSGWVQTSPTSKTWMNLTPGTVSEIPARQGREPRLVPVEVDGNIVLQRERENLVVGKKPPKQAPTVEVTNPDGSKSVQEKKIGMQTAPPDSRVDERISQLNVWRKGWADILASGDAGPEERAKAEAQIKSIDAELETHTRPVQVISYDKL